MSLLLFMIVGAFLALTASVDRPLVTTTDGPVLGVDIDGIHVFRGIPYAAPPIGDLRWRPPQRHPRWTKALDASGFGATCGQWVSMRSHDGDDGDGGDGDSCGNGDEDGDGDGDGDEYPCGMWNSIDVSKLAEDCLFVNIYAPKQLNATSLNKTLPVMVYIHAGEFMYGSSNDRESNFPFFAKNELILVTFNFRIGIFGFLAADVLRSLSPNGGTGNYGMLDQRFALDWIHRNILAFGGDPAQVTIFGESSGGTSVAYHLTSPLSWPYFHRAILQSPGIRQIKQWQQSQINFNFVMSVLAVTKVPGCPISPNQYTEFAGIDLGMAQAIRNVGNESLQESQRWCTQNTTCAGFTWKSWEQLTLFYSSVGQIEYAVNGFYSPGVSGLYSYIKAGPTGQAALKCLQGMPSSFWNNLDNLPSTDTMDSDTWGPVLDGVDLPDTLEAAVARAVLAPVDVLLGSNLDEVSTFMELIGNPPTCNASWADFQQWTQSYYGQKLGTEIAGMYENLTKPIPNLDCLQHQSPNLDTLGSPKSQVLPGYWRAAAMRAASDSSFLCPTRELARALASRTNTSVFKYYFTRTPSMSVNQEDTKNLGAFHGADVPFVFMDKFELTSNADLALSTAMACYWREFAKTGDPNSGECRLLRWPKFKPKEETTLELSVKRNGTLDLQHLLNGPHQAQCDLFAKWLSPTFSPRAADVTFVI